MMIHSDPPNARIKEADLSNNGDLNNNSRERHDQYRIIEQYHSQPNHQKIICVGAGAAGLLLAYKMQKMKARDYELVVYEKNPQVAGTWYENRYPGCACDV
jgi:NADPH-dependent 2,4-dienoyl-CoA reductase/sulfur reductase-like enzyme